MILELKNQLQKKDSYIVDLEGYIDNLVVKVLDIQPKLLLAAEEKSTDECDVKIKQENNQASAKNVTGKQSSGRSSSSSFTSNQINNNQNSQNSSNKQNTGVSKIPAGPARSNPFWAKK